MALFILLETCFKQKKLKKLIKNYGKIKKQIAIPIFIKKTVSDYELLAKGIRVYLK